jgi:hypothetical protein
VRFTGWFTKRGKGAFDGYRRRFFVLTGTTLSYYISEGAGFGAELKGTIKIKPGTTAEVREGQCWRQSCCPHDLAFHDKRKLFPRWAVSWVANAC